MVPGHRWQIRRTSRDDAEPVQQAAPSPPSGPPAAVSPPSGPAASVS